jgi:predicted O-methyltransferase YrrM
MHASQEQWTAIDEYLGKSLTVSDKVLDEALEASAAAGLPPIQVSACQGKLLQILARLHGARAILEIGTLGGYSTIWLARALPDGGRLITLELSPEHAAVASANLARANLSKVVELRVGPALDILPRLATEGRGPFDLIFIDADKPNTPHYFRWALKLSRRGSIIVVDNVIRKGALLDLESSDPAVQGMREFLQVLGAEQHATATAIQTVGSKGYDGFAIALVTGEPVLA